MNTYYKFSFYLNARHSVSFNGKASNIHPHTWGIAIIFASEEEETINFTAFEKEIEEYFSSYEGKYLNEQDPFKNINPTMENIAKVLYVNIKEFINNKNLNFKSIAISENPTRTYIIEA
jgi:6-pyruvoyltetrahydropterin/6-carboxytetrahydropterin synthase